MHDLGDEVHTCVHLLSGRVADRIQEHEMASWMLFSLLNEDVRRRLKRKTTHRTTRLCTDTRAHQTTHTAHNLTEHTNRRLPVRHLQLFLRSLRSSIAQFSIGGWASSWSSSHFSHRVVWSWAGSSRCHGRHRRLHFVPCCLATCRALADSHADRHGIGMV